MKRVLVVCGSPEHCAPGYSTPYEEALRAAGIDPVIIRPGEPVPSNYAGLMLMGGSDVNPALYNAVQDVRTEGSDDARDRLECGLIGDALSRDLPLLAICRGLQILNVQHGGTLIQHLDTTAHHRVRTADRGVPVHKVEILPGTKLASIAGAARAWDVNSRHHQAIDRVGGGLHVSARDPEDGVIEAVERPDRRFVVGVQWHPENQAPSDEHQASLFRAFAAEL
jgi:gamma-glutamyl-gamma-aminobutyrate hydrolase PuuD